MANNRLPKYLGLRLEQAGLISSAQVQIALQDQIQYNHLEIEDILTLRGWLKPETIEFFSEQIVKLINCSKKITLIKCLQKAGLLTNEEIEKIVTTQKETGMVLDSLLVNLGYIKQSTIDFFKKYLLINKSETQITPKVETVTPLRDSNSADFQAKNPQKKAKKTEFFDPKTTSNLKISLPRDSFILSLRLNQAGLLSEPQIEIALRDCNRHDDFTLEEILILRGWLKPETIAFFLEKFPQLINQPKTLSLAECLKQAGLLSKENIENISKSQQETGKKFDVLAVEKGYIKQATLDFFLNYLVDKDLENLSFKKSPTQWETIFDPTPSLGVKQEESSLTKIQPENTRSDRAIESQEREDNDRDRLEHWSEAKTVIGAGPL